MGRPHYEKGGKNSICTHKLLYIECAICVRNASPNVTILHVTKCKAYMCAEPTNCYDAICILCICVIQL